MRVEDVLSKLEKHEAEHFGTSVLESGWTIKKTL